MAKGFRNASGVDFDGLFDPYVQGTPPTSTGLRDSGGVDLAGQFAPIAFGSKGADVGFRTSAGVDVSNLWAALGTAAYSIVGLHGKTLTASDVAITNQPTVSASAGVSVLNNGTWSVFASTSQGPGVTPAPTSGTWLPAGATVADFEVQFNITSSGAAGRQTSNGAPAYASASTSRGASLALPTISGNNATERSASGTVTILLRRISTGAISTSNVGINLSTVGWV